MFHGWLAGWLAGGGSGAVGNTAGLQRRHAFALPFHQDELAERFSQDDDDDDDDNDDDSRTHLRGF